jgi:N4-gp56 family major capsid protein
MAFTTPTNVDTSIPEIWAKTTLRSHKAAGFWGRFTGPEGSGAPIIQKTELVGGPGDYVHVQITAPLANAGVSGDTTTLEGNEEALTTTSLHLQPEYYRHAVGIYRRAAKKSIIALRPEAQMRLAEWGMVKMDDLRFTNFAATTVPLPVTGDAYTPNFHTAGGTDGSPHIDDIAAGDKLTVAEIQKIRLKLENQLAKPVMVDGQPVYFLVTHPNSLFDLKREAEYRDWVREAEVRGSGNPFFRGAVAMIDGMVIHSHPRVPTATNAGTVKVSKGVAFGSEAFVEALDESADWDEDVFDYGNKLGVAYGFACYARRALELSSIQVYAAAADVT